MIRAMATPPDPSLRDEQVERTRLGSAERAPAPLLDGLPESTRELLLELNRMKQIALRLTQ